MGDFLTSPRERAASNLFDMSVGGKLPPGFENSINTQAGLAKTGLEQQGAQQGAQVGGDILSQLSSAGVSPGSSAASELGTKAKVGIAENVQGGESQIDSKAMQEQLSALMNFLNVGYSGLSSSSTFGDIMAGLDTGANVFSGIMGGLGSQGLNIFKK